MPQYDFKNLETGEVMEVTLRLSEYNEWKKQNPEWERYYPSSSAPKLVSGTKDAMAMAGRDWQDHLTRIKKNSGKDNTINV